MTPEEEDDAAIAAEYVLGLLTPAEAAAFEARMAVDPQFRALAARWTEDLSLLADAIPEEAPPRGLEARITRELWGEERAGRRGVLGRLGLWPALGGALVAALLLLAVLNLDALRGTGAPELAARVAAEDDSLVVLAQFDADAGRLTLEREAGGVAEGRAQELWLIAGGEAPVSLGLLPAAGEAVVEVPEALAAIEGAVLAISDEPPGGSPTGAPTGAVLATGPLTPL